MSQIVFSLTAAQVSYLRAIDKKEELWRYDYRSFTSMRDRGLVAEGSSWREAKLTKLGRAALAVVKLLPKDATR